MLYAEENKIIPELSNSEKEIAQNFLQKTAQTLGNKILNQLNKAEIIAYEVQTIVHKDKTKHNIPHIKVKQDLIEDILFVPLSFNKPKISKRPRPEFVKITDKDNIIDLKLTSSHNAQIFFKENKNRIIFTKQYEELLKSYTEIPMSINIKVLQNIFQLYIEIFRINEDVINNPLIKSFFSSFYFIDLNPIIEANKDNKKNMSVLQDLVNYSLHLNWHHDRNLQLIIEGHDSYKNIYNKVSSYKYIIKGLLNDANFFSHFNYFYIEKYATSSGRLFSASFFLQLQGYKLARCLIDFKSKKPLIEETYLQYINIIKEEVPEITLHPELEKSISMYKKHNNNLYLKQLLSLFKFHDTSMFQFYANSTELKDKINWICLHIKKPKEIWIAYSLLEKYLDGFHSTALYQQDATSSAIQLIGMLTNDPHICKISNIVGKEYIDVYSQYSTLLSHDVKTLITFVSSKLMPMLDRFPLVILLKDVINTICSSSNLS